MTTIPSSSRSRTRRGNAMILVTGIMVLLVIIAATYITRTQSGRITGVAAQQSATRANNADLIAETIAAEIAGALFAAPVDVNDPALGVSPTAVADSNWPRLTVRRNPVRYAIDTTDFLDNATGLLTPDADGNGIADGDGQPDYPYNVAPRHLVPGTNWPDGSLWPQGEGAPTGVSGFTEGNPVGNPGFGDSRWLRDTEPQRWDSNGNGFPDAFKSWRHLTNLSRPNNGWRICRDISDITDADGDGFGGVVTDLSIPVEQWPSGIEPDPSFFSAFSANSTGDGIVADAFIVDRYQEWMSPPDDLVSPSFGYPVAYQDVFKIPLNFLHLKDLDADNIYLEPGERPQDEFIAGTARWTVGRVLADTDGDGFTDALWHLAPTPIERGIRQVVAVSVVDNSGLAPVNVGTRFTPANTAGETPADLPLTGQQEDWIGAVPDAWNVGFFDAFENWYRSGTPSWPDVPSAINRLYNKTEIKWSDNRWPDFLVETGIGIAPLVSATILEDPLARRAYWLNSGSRPFNAFPGAPDFAGLTPFTLSDEMELRLFHGQNTPWAITRFERALDTSNGSDYNFARIPVSYEETSPFREQLNNPELLRDNRRKMTLFSAARNDLTPAWLWWRFDTDFDSRPDLIQDTINQGLAPEDTILGNFLTQFRRKIDLREPGPIGDDISPLPSAPPNGYAAFDRGLYLHERLPWQALLALSDGDHLGGEWYFDETYDHDELRRLAAAYTANLLAYRDADTLAPVRNLPDPSVIGVIDVAPQIGAVPLPNSQEILNNGGDDGDETRYLGMEHQPFLVEAFIAHVHSSEPLPPSPTGPPQLDGFPGNFTDLGHTQTTIVVIQIANPFDVEIPVEDLRRYKLRVLDRELDLGDLPLGTLTDLPSAMKYDAGDPAGPAFPATKIFYMIPQSFDHSNPTIGTIADFRDRWLDFLDIEGVHAPAGTQFIAVPDDTWSSTRTDYDGYTMPAHRNAIELIREDDDPILGERDVVVDRFDYDEDDVNHDQLIRRFQSFDAPPAPGVASFGVPPMKPGIRIDQDDWFVQWARVTRAWGFDFDYNAAAPPTHGIQLHERAPRFVIADQQVTIGDEDTFQGDANDPPAEAYKGSAFVNGLDPDTSPWFTAQYVDATQVNESAPMTTRRKPTFFHGGLGDTSLTNLSYPDKGFYGTRTRRVTAPFQMLQKDGDFQQVGEALNVWLYGHEMKFQDLGANGFDYEYTQKTFSENLLTGPAGVVPLPSTELRFLNRLQPGEVVGRGDPTNPRDIRHAAPALPAAARLIDAFVCDGPGHTGTFGTIDEFRNANGFTGRSTPGLININTAPVEVLRTLPHWNKIVHVTTNVNDTGSVLTASLPRTALAEAAVSYRDRIQNMTVPGGFGQRGGPDYSDRGVANLREERGFASTGELLLLDKTGLFDNVADPLGTIFQSAWRIDFASRNPFLRRLPTTDAAHISTDVNNRMDPIDLRAGDSIARDAEEANLLFAGASNLVTTTSDTFTVYFRIRSFRQTPAEPPVRPFGVWDATNPEYIVDDTRYVMHVDRSGVMTPDDPPKIRFLEKVQQ